MKNVKSLSFALASLALGCFVALGGLSGCNNTTENGSGGAGTKTDDHDHEHGTDEHGTDEHGEDGHDHGNEQHAHVHGPNDGELFDFESHAFRGEITTLKGESTLTIYILEHDKDDAKSIKAEKIIAKQSQGRDAQQFEFAAANADENGMASKFQLTSDDALKAYNVFGFNLDIDVDGKIHTAKVVKNPHPD